MIPRRSIGSDNTTKETNMKILVIEDNRKHTEDARSFFAGQSDTEVVFAPDFKNAREHLEPGKVDGVISDIHFPSTLDEWGAEHASCGVAVMVICQERVIPCVLNTAGYHHGRRYQWVCSLQRELTLPEIVDASNDRDAEADTKNWDEALRRLRELMEAGPCTQHNRYHNVRRGFDESLRHTCC